METMDAADRFVALLDGHRKILFKVASAYARDAGDRQDLAQEIVVQLWRSFGRYDEARPFATWMYRIALNVAISFHRGESRRRQATVPVGEEILEVVAPDDTAAALERDRMIERALGLLDELDRALLLLYLDGERHDAIAAILGLSVSNVGTRIGRIKERLRRNTWTSTT